MENFIFCAVLHNIKWFVLQNVLQMLKLCMCMVGSNTIEPNFQNCLRNDVLFNHKYSFNKTTPAHIYGNRETT